MNSNDIITKFLSENKITERKNVLGVFFYGSYLWGLENKNSDLDIHVIIKNGPERRIRKIYDGVIVECFERRLSNVYKLVEYDFNNNRTMNYSMLGHGKILYDKDGSAKKLQQYILDKYKDFKFLKSDHKEYEKQIVELYIGLERLKIMQKENSKFFYGFYFLVLDEIRCLYQKTNGLSQDISKSKVFKFYTDKAYNFSKFKKLPDDDFIKLYLKALNVKTKKHMMKNITHLFNLVNDKSIQDFNNCEVSL